MNIEMTKDQAMAQKVWLESATYDNEFRPMGMDALAKELKEKHDVQTSSSALGRWRAKFGWNEILEVQISTALTSNEEIKDLVEKSSMAEGSKRFFDDYSANEKINEKTYDLATAILVDYECDVRAKKKLSYQDKKLIIELLKVSSDRKDKMLDRQNEMAIASGITLDDIVDRIDSKTIDIEVDNGYELVDEKISILEIEIDE